MVEILLRHSGPILSNSVVAQGGLRSLQKLSINGYLTTNILWPKLEKLCLLYCEEDSLVPVADPAAG